MKFIKKFIFSSIILFTVLQGNEVFIHEGLVTKVGEIGPLLAVPKLPPKALKEKIPIRPNGDFVWLPGYWSWDSKMNNFSWVNGFWRKLPPEKIWVQGKWHQSKEGWVWLSGFWSDKDVNSFDFIAIEPPDLIEEEIAKPTNQHYFWVPGHYRHQNNAYTWVKGYWEKFDPQWVLTPAHYHWRPEGFIFVSSFWDWPLSERGEIYESLDPVQVLSKNDIVNRLFYSYPDYLHLFAHYNHFQKNAIQDTPPWWSWQTWWSYNWANQWALWWWYTHPGYIQPKWITEEISQNIMPPSRQLEKAILFANPPLIVTEKGVISSRKAAKILRKIENHSELALSSKNLEHFQNAIQPKRKSNFKALQPHGKTNAMLLSRPQFFQNQSEKKNTRSPIKPYLKKLRSKLIGYQDLAVDNSTTDTQKYWEEEIRERDKRQNAAWSERKKAYEDRSSAAVKDWDENVRERNLERGTYADESYRHDVKDYNEQQFWQPQIDAREKEYSEEQNALEEERKEHYQEEQDAYKRIYGETLSYSSSDARRDAARSDTRRYMQNRENIRRDNLRYMQNQENIKRDNLQYQLKQENLKQDQLKYDQRNEEKKKEDEQFWEELHKLEKERGDISSANSESWWIDKETNQDEVEKFWKEQDQDKEETKRRGSSFSSDVLKFGLPLPQSKDFE